MRFATDTGGTFTDLIVEDDSGLLRAYKSSTIPGDPVKGVLDVLSVAADDFKMPLAKFLQLGDSLIHGTTHAINAVITRNVATTAFITTAGHRDMLIMREGGRSGAFDHHLPYPEPYIPRQLCFEVIERIDAQGHVVQTLDEAAAIDVIEELRRLEVEAVAVCLLWSIQNSAHEIRIGELLEEHLPGVPYTLSHELNPVIREFRRASSACIDASLKPLMSRYLGGLRERLADAGFDGRVLVLTSKGGMQDAATVAKQPIQVLNSGPSMAPVAGKYFGLLEADSESEDIIVADTGGTTYDVSIVRDGLIPLTLDMWIGVPFQGHLTGFPSVDVTSVGAGGGSIAAVDSGGVLHVGPKSAGADPGPACYQRGGDKATVTDAAVVLGYIDPDYFLGGKMQLDGAAAEAAIKRDVADLLQCDVYEAALAVMSLTTENMVQAIVDITTTQGIDPRRASLIGGGGAAGMNSVFIARRLGCKQLIFPEVGAMLSAAGAIMSDLVAEYRSALFLSSDDFRKKDANALLRKLEKQCQGFIEQNRSKTGETSIAFSVEAQYENQVWTINVPLRAPRFDENFSVEHFIADFHQAHERIYTMSDADSAVEIVGWSATARCGVGGDAAVRLKKHNSDCTRGTVRQACFGHEGLVNTRVFNLQSMEVNRKYSGPAIVETPFTTIVADPDSTFWLTSEGSIVMQMGVQMGKSD